MADAATFDVQFGELNVIGGGGGVSTFNGRTGVVKPESGDYTAEMVGADTTGTATAEIATHSTDATAHADIRAAIIKKTSQLENDGGYLTRTDIPDIIQQVIDAAWLDGSEVSY